MKKLTPKNKVRIVTAASLFDGHDAAINIMRRIIQATGCEVIHLGHDRSIKEIVNYTIEESIFILATFIIIYFHHYLISSKNRKCKWSIKSSSNCWFNKINIISY